MQRNILDNAKVDLAEKESSSPETFMQSITGVSRKSNLIKKAYKEINDYEDALQLEKELDNFQ